LKAYSASTTINAPPEVIWQILTDAPNYPAWDPWAIRIEGTIALGQTIKAYSKLDPSRAFPARVTEFVPEQRMVWTGGMPLGLFTGVRSFSLNPQTDSTVEFTIREEFSGLLLPLFGGSLPDMNGPFQDFVNGLKARAEGTAPPNQ
jgi:hypothetical protein